MNQNKTMTIGRFEVHKRLGAGMQGKVYLGWDPKLEREVALKVITGTGGNMHYSQDIINEAKIVASIASPNVISLYEAGIYGTTPLLVFEYVDGMTLTKYLKKNGRFNESDALSIIVRVAVGLKAAHDKGVMHLDLSPNNIMIDKQNRPRIMDFGLARISTVIDTDRMKDIAGTPRYLAPEHVMNKPFTYATDIYSLGLIFFECLCGTPAFTQADIPEILKAIENGNIDWPSLQRLDISAEIIALLRDMLQPDPSQRFNNVDNLIKSIDDVIEIKRQEDNHQLALEFLLRRLNRRPEFPACSNSITEINRLTDEETNTDFNKLGSVIARDYSLTNRVMKIANSVVFDRGSGGVKTISQAISRLGLKLVRMICNGLLLFKQLDDKDDKLKDTLVASFVAGLIGRHVGSSIKRSLAEEAFICSLFHKLGLHLLVFYLPDEYEDIERLIHAGKDRQVAEREVLSTTSAALGKTVAKKWNFPQTIITCMSRLATGPVPQAIGNEAVLQHIANYSNDLCELVAAEHDHDELLLLVDEFIQRHHGLYPCDAVQLAKLVSAAAEKFYALAPSLGIDVNKSHFCKQLEQFALQLDDAINNQQQVAVQA